MRKALEAGVNFEGLLWADAGSCSEKQVQGIMGSSAAAQAEGDSSCIVQLSLLINFAGGTLAAIWRKASNSCDSIWATVEPPGTFIDRKSVV